MWVFNNQWVKIMAMLFTMQILVSLFFLGLLFTTNVWHMKNSFNVRIGDSCDSVPLTQKKTENLFIVWMFMEPPFRIERNCPNPDSFGLQGYLFLVLETHFYVNYILEIASDPICPSFNYAIFTLHILQESSFVGVKMQNF